MSDYTNDHINATQEQTQVSPAPISGLTERSAATQEVVARPVGARGGGTWKTKSNKSRKEKMHWSCIKEVPKKDSKALTMTLKKKKIGGFADWKRARPVAGKSGYVTVMVSFKPAIDDATLWKYVGAVDDLIRIWNVKKHEIPNVQHNRVALGRALKEFGGDIEYRWAGFADKEKTYSKVIFQHKEGEAVSIEEGAELMVLFEKHFETAEREANLWEACELAGRTITVHDPKKFSGILHKLRQEIRNNRESEGIDMIPAKIRGYLVVVAKRLVTGADGKRHSQMRLDFKENSDADQLTDQQYNNMLSDLTQHWAKRCATWERVYADKDAQKEVEIHSKEVITRWVRFLKNKWMLSVLANVKEIISSTSSKEEAGKVFLDGIEKQVLKDTERKARMRNIFTPKVERTVEEVAGAHSKKLVRETMDEVYGGGAAAKKGKKQKQKQKKQKQTTVSIASLVEEFRIDTADGNAYTRESFVEVYGPDHGMEKWNKAVRKKIDLAPTEVEVKETVVVGPVAEAVETPPVAKVDASLKSNPFAALATPREFTA